METFFIQGIQVVILSLISSITLGICLYMFYYVYILYTNKTDKLPNLKFGRINVVVGLLYWVLIGGFIVIVGLIGNVTWAAKIGLKSDIIASLKETNLIVISFVKDLIFLLVGYIIKSTEGNSQGK